MIKMSGKEAALLSPPPLRTARMTFAICRSSLSNALLGTRLRHILRRLHDTHLEPTNIAVNMLPVDGRPIHFRVGGCTNRIIRCHLLFLLSRFAGFSREERP